MIMTMFRIIKRMFIVLVSSIVNASNYIKFVSLSNQKCEIQPTLINFHPNEFSQELDDYPFVSKLVRHVGSCNTIDDLSGKVCVKSKRLKHDYKNK